MEFVGVGAASANTGNTAGRSISPAVPAGVQAGDVLVIYLVGANHTSVGVCEVNTPSGWTALLADETSPTASANYIFVKTAGGSESAPTISVGTSGGEKAQMAALRGVTLPVDDFQSDSTQSSASSSQIQWPSVTPTAGSSMVLAFGATWAEWTSVSASSGFTLISQSTNVRSMVWQYKLHTGGTVPSDVFSFTGTTAAAAAKRGFAAVFPSANAAPTADAGPDQEVNVGDLVELDGTGSSDPDVGDTLSYSWEVTDAGGTELTTGDLTGANTATPSFVAPEIPDGPYAVDSFPAPGPTGCGLTFDGTHLWQADLNGKLYRIDPESGAVVEERATPGSGPIGLAHDGDNLWLADRNTDLIYKLDPAEPTHLSLDYRAGDRIVATHPPALDLTDAITVVVRIRLTPDAGNTSYRQFMVQDGGGGGLAWHRGIRADGIGTWYERNLGNWVPSGFPGHDGVWHEYVYSYDKDAGTNNQRIYCDGQLLAQRTATGSLAVGTANLNIIHGDFLGDMAEARVYDRQLTPQEVADLHAGKPVTDGLVAHWKMSEGTGTTLAESVGGSNATLTGGSWVKASVLDEIPAPAAGGRDLAWDGTNLWACDIDTDLIYKLDPSDGTVLDSFATPGGSPLGLEWINGELWATNDDANPANDLIYRIDPSDGTILNAYRATPGTLPTGLAWDGEFLWNGDLNTDTLYKIDLTPSTARITLTLTVEDTGGLTDTDTVVITVNDAALIEWTGTGGVEVGGSALVEYVTPDTITGSGGVLVGGSAVVEDLTFTILADVEMSGGLLLGGHADASKLSFEVHEPVPPAVLLPTYEAVLVARVPALSGVPELVVVDRLVVAGLSYTHELNRPGQANLGLPVRSLSPAVKERLANLARFPCEVWIYRDEHLDWAGEIQTLQVQGQTLTINCTGLLGYMFRMGVTEDLVFNDEDQFTIAKALVDHWQELPQGHYGIDTSDIETSGVTRDRTYLRDELHNIGERLQELAEVENGFDLHVDPATRKLVLSYPQRGRDLTASVFFDERNIDSAAVALSVSPDDLVTDVSATGTRQQEDGENTVTYAARENLTLRGWYGRSWAGVNFSNVSQAETVTAHADAYLAARDGVFFQPGVTIMPRPGADVGDFEPGDTVSYSYDAGLGLMSGEYRVAKVTVTVNEGGEQRIGVEFV